MNDNHTAENSQDAADAAAEPSIYTLIGGEATVRALVKRFYQLMDTLPAAQGIRHMHAADLSPIEEKLVLYLTGWLGGPQLYIEKYGHPMLRARHLPFSIGSSEIKQWLLCMRQALNETVADPGVRAHIDSALTGLALHMRNRRDDAPVATANPSPDRTTNPAADQSSP
jgi:hemoglobin